jgi:hypothetical protein
MSEEERLALAARASFVSFRRVILLANAAPPAGPKQTG